MKIWVNNNKNDETQSGFGLLLLFSLNCYTFNVLYKVIGEKLSDDFRFSDQK